MKVRPCPVADHGASTTVSTKLLPACWSDPWGGNWELFPRQPGNPPNKERSFQVLLMIGSRIKGEKVTDGHHVLPERILCRKVCAIGSVEQLCLCVMLILIQEKPTGVHRGNLTTNHASFFIITIPYSTPNINIHLSLFTIQLLQM